MLLDVLFRLKLRMLGSLQPAKFRCIERLQRRRLKPQRGFLPRSLESIVMHGEIWSTGEQPEPFVETERRHQRKLPLLGSVHAVASASSLSGTTSPRRGPGYRSTNPLKGVQISAYYWNRGSYEIWLAGT